MPKAQIHILNGPNLNLLGTREPDVYGKLSLSELGQQCRQLLKSISPDTELVFKQSNHEGELIDWLHAAYKDDIMGVVINGGGYSHTSVSLRDAVAAIDLPVIEVHLSNIYARENYRQESLLSPVATGVIAGMGSLSYFLGMQAIVNLNATDND